MVWIVCLYREIDHSSADLYCLVVARKKWCPLFDEHQGSKFTLVILEHKLAVFKFNLRVAPTYRDIVDSEVTFVATT
jgi:hypothetical protein